MAQTTYRLESRTVANPFGTGELISRGETRGGALAAFDSFVRADTTGAYGPHGQYRLVVLAEGGAR